MQKSKIFEKSTNAKIEKFRKMQKSKNFEISKNAKIEKSNMSKNVERLISIGNSMVSSAIWI